MKTTILYLQNITAQETGEGYNINNTIKIVITILWQIQL